MLLRTLNVIGTVWLVAFLGTGLALVGTALGWALAQIASLPPVRLIAWWVRRVALPVLWCRSWVRRAGAIFINNISILAALTILGRWHGAALVGVACLGVSLGIGLRILLNEPETRLGSPLELSTGATRAVKIGVALNLLEPPAIMLAIGLCLGRQSIPLLPEQVWSTFALWVVPAALLAAAGEALWLGAIHESHQPRDAATRQTADPDADQ